MKKKKKKKANLIIGFVRSDVSIYWHSKKMEDMILSGCDDYIKRNSNGI